MKEKIHLLRVCYWWGIVADAVMAIQMLFPRLFLRIMHVDLPPDRGFMYGLRMGAPLMIGWTMLLLWADREPAARKDVLPLTVPVIVGYVLIEVHTLASGLAPLGRTIALFAMQAGMVSLFTFSYLRARSLRSGA